MGTRAFKLSDKFLSQYENTKPNWGYGDLSYFTYKRTYSRLMENGEKEEWWQTVKRVVEGCFEIQRKHCEHWKLEWIPSRAQKSAQVMYDKIFNFKFTPAGRGLWAMGTEIIDKIGSSSLNNCTYVTTANIDKDFTDPFCYTMDMSMLTVGVGFDVLGAEKEILIKEPSSFGGTIVIDDSREGWVECLRSVLNAYQGGPKYDYDYSLIRPEGSPIKTMGGIAPGPEPLKLLVKCVREVLDRRIGEFLTSIDILDLMCLIGRCVVSGNLRRSALIALGDSKDKDFITAKDPEKHSGLNQSHRWASNNSIYAKVGQSYKDIADLIRKNGEPGLIWMDNARSFGRFKDGFDDRDIEVTGVNPCSEILLISKEFCNLVETYPANHDSPEEYIETLKYAFMFGKTVSLIPTHNQASNAIIGRNRRIGISMSGIEQAIIKFGRRRFLNDFCDKGYATIRNWDRVYSRWLCIPESIRVTTVKPSGTVSILAGAFPGIHKTHGKRYLRLVRVGANSPYVAALRESGYLVEDDYYDKSSKVAYFPIEESNFKRSKGETPLRELVQNVADLQYYWSDNSVSVTATFSPEEEDQIEEVLETYEDRLKTISFLPYTGHGYIQAPYMSIVDNEMDLQLVGGVDGGLYKVNWLVDEFEEYKSKIDSKKFARMIKEIDEEAVAEKFCTNDSCELVGVTNEDTRETV